MKDAIVTTDAIEPTLNNWHRIQDTDCEKK
jgi:hypothetical protein